jgi:hypothetical protein
MRSGPTPIPDAAGGEGGHGAAKADPVIHRCISNFFKIRLEGEQGCKQYKRSMERISVERIKAFQMAGRSIGKAWQLGKGKPRDALCRKLACCLCAMCPCYL